MQPFTRLIVFLVTISCFFPLNVRSFHINNAQRIKQQHHLTEIKQTYINDLVAEEAALEATRIYGIDSPEARLAWETFEETRAAASHWAAASHTKKNKKTKKKAYQKMGLIIPLPFFRDFQKPLTASRRLVTYLK
mmetsp:Transcript_57839/g.133592  ORF Transcript_57839/g.133592 Transcript_57839/m.133592 type:complete len:135 (+) Transcript_57839:50-454(+)